MCEGGCKAALTVYYIAQPDHIVEHENGCSTACYNLICCQHIIYVNTSVLVSVFSCIQVS